MRAEDMVGRCDSTPLCKRGSILMEFMLMLPVLLLLFGATMLWMDISLGKMYIQEANRNLAWLAEDRYDDNRLCVALHSAVREPYELRNKIEKGFGNSEAFWRFGPGATNGWGHLVADGEFRNGKQRLDLSQECEWNSLVSGNMELQMAHLSGVYMGAIALGSVLQPDGETRHFYEAAYDFTRSRAGSSNTNDSVVAKSFNPEAVVVHRGKPKDQREDVDSPNKLLPVLKTSWPTDGTSLQEMAEEALGDVFSSEAGGDVDDAGEGDRARRTFIRRNELMITQPALKWWQK